MIHLWAKFTSWRWSKSKIAVGLSKWKKSSPYLLSIFIENYSSFQIRVFPALVSFFILSDNFFNFGPIFKCHTERMEKVNWTSRSRTLCWFFWKKKSLKKSDIQEACQTLKIIDVVISSHIISFRFPDTSWWLRKTKINWFEAEKSAVTTEKKLFFLIISKGQIFKANRKKSLYR